MDASNYSQIIFAPETLSEDVVRNIKKGTRIDLWDIETEQTLSLLGKNIYTPTLLNKKETLQEKFERILSPSRENSGVTVNLSLESQKWIQTYNKSFKQFIESLRDASISIRKEILPLVKGLTITHVVKEKITGKQLAHRLFHPDWFSLYENTTREEKKLTARICLELLAADELLSNIQEGHFNMKAYWSLYSEEPKCVIDIRKQMKKRCGTTLGYNSHLGFILWLMGHKKLAEDLLLNENFEGLCTDDILHMTAVGLTLMGHIEKANVCMQRLSSEYFLDIRANPHKWFYQALAYKAVGEEEKMCLALVYGAKYDPLFDKKEYLLERVNMALPALATAMNFGSLEVFSRDKEF